MDRDEYLLAAHEAARLLNIKPATLYDWAKKGLVPHIRILAGKKRPVLRFRREELLQFIEKRARNDSISGVGPNETLS